MTLRAIPAVIALLLLSAHFLRGGGVTAAVACGLLPLLLLVRRRIALRIVQCALAAGVVIWIHTAAVLMWMRMQIGAPWLRMLVILFMGFSSGLPLLVTGSTLQAWMS